MNGAKQVEGVSKWLFKKKHFKPREKSELKMSHLEHEKNKFDHQGLQYAFIGFDELTHFTQSQFFYIMSRNRSVCWIKPFIRCTMNPDPESWVADFIKWYIDDEGFIIPERDWVIRYFTIVKDNPVWGNTPQEVIDQVPQVFAWIAEEEQQHMVKSFTFIEWSLDENKELLAKDPTYRANLLAQDEITKKALLERCWKPVQDNLAIVNYDSLKSIFSNYVEPSNDRYITVDVAGYGKDLAVIKVWEWFKVVKIKVFTKCSPEQLYDAIELERRAFKIPKHKVVYDNDWLGWGIAGKDYTSFNWWGPAIEVDGVKEYYKDLKTQCFYRIIEQVINKDSMSITDTEIYVDWEQTTIVIIDWKKHDVLLMIRDDLKAIKRYKADDEGKRRINPKSEQKQILKGRSPDFADTIMMRYSFELKSKKKVQIFN